MFTVLTRYRLTQRELVHQAQSVEFRPSRNGGEKGYGLLVTLTDGNSELIGFSRTDEEVRDVYVMNERGSTVAHYVL